MKCCNACGAGPMVPMHRWKPGDVRDAGRGICGRCAMARRRDGSIIDAERRSFTLEDFVDTWRALVVREDCATLPRIATAMGRSPVTVRARLRQARAAGMYVPEVADDYSRIRSQALRSTAGRRGRAALSLAWLPEREQEWRTWEASRRGQGWRATAIGPAVRRIWG